MKTRKRKRTVKRNVHKFKSPRPILIYDTRNKLLSFAGGGYTIPSEGIDG